MIDPVTGFAYPDAWIARCHSSRMLDLAVQGLGVLTSSGTVLRRGFTTGTTAAAAAKAAILSRKNDVTSVPVTLPCRITVNVPVRGHAGCGSSAKYAGDYPDDATAGLEFCAETRPQASGMTIEFGDGIGRFARDTPRFRKGMPAVTPTALSCIVQSVQEALDANGEQGIIVRISAPRGREIAEGTLNPRLGIEGGISVLGTTGLVEPWDDHLVGSMRERIAAADGPVLTTGRIGLRFSRLLFPEREVILVGGNLQEALDAAHGDVILCGLPGLILRYINPRILDGTGCSTVEDLVVSPRFPALLTATLADFRTRQPQTTVVLINREGRIIGESP